MKKFFIILTVFLCFFSFSVSADENYDAYVPNCITQIDDKLYIPVEFSIRNSKKFTSSEYGRMHLMDLREDVKCTINTFESKLFDDIILDNNYLYGVLKEEYTSGVIPDEIYNASYIDGEFDYSRYSTNIIFECINDSDNNYYNLNNIYDNLIIGDEKYCNHVNKIFNKDYNITVENKETVSSVIIDSVETASDNPDILYLVLLVTLTLLFFFVLLEIRKQNTIIKKRK